MPELPEVEVTRRSLGARLAGARVAQARLGAALRWPLGREPQALGGLVAGELQRRGKYLWLPLAGDVQAPEGGLLLHLGMSGSLGFDETLRELPGERPRHVHFELLTDRGLLSLTDPRRFGAVVWSPGLAVPPASVLLSRLGHEPFDAALTAAVLHQGLQRRRSAVKTALLAGDIVVGAGNIYACEALHAAGIDPRSRSDRLSRPRTERLLQSLRATLEQALALGGSTLRDFRDAHGMAGAFQSAAGVYGREGLPCRRCGTPVRRIVQQQRSTFFCPGCQKR